MESKVPTWLVMLTGIFLRGTLYGLSGYLLHFSYIRRGWHGFDPETTAGFVGAFTLPLAGFIWSWFTLHHFWRKLPPDSHNSPPLPPA